MHGETVRPGAGEAVGQGHFGVDRVRGVPGGAQAPERRAVADAPGFEEPVQLVHVQRDGVGRWPCADRSGGRAVPVGRGFLGADRAGRVPGPGRGVGAGGGLGPGVEVHRAPPRGVLGPHPYAQVYGVVVGGVAGQQQRGGEGQFLHESTAEAAAHVRGQLHEGRAGHDHGSGHGVVGEPGWVAGEIRPVKRVPASSGSSTSAPSSGWSTADWPAATGSRPAGRASSQ